MEQALVTVSPDMKPAIPDIFEARDTYGRLLGNIRFTVVGQKGHEFTKAYAFYPVAGCPGIGEKTLQAIRKLVRAADAARGVR